jgi:hypothetical protein
MALLRECLWEVRKLHGETVPPLLPVRSSGHAPLEEPTRRQPWREAGASTPGRIAERRQRAARPTEILEDNGD